MNVLKTKARVIIDKITPNKTYKKINIKKLEDGIYLIPMGGVNEIGMNLNLLISKRGKEETWIIVDAGTSIANELGLTTVLPNVDHIDLSRVTGIVCTHAHMDHIGGLPYIIDRCPNAKIYATKFTQYLVQGMISRNGISRQTKMFKDYEVVERNQPFNIGDFQIVLVHITHSTPESNFIFIRSVNYNYTIAHSGDWKLDHAPGIGKPTDLRSIRKYSQGGIDVLLCDSTNAMKDKSAPSESLVKKNLLTTIRDNIAPKRSIIVSCFSSNVDRVTAIIGVANQLGIKACLLGRSMEKMYHASMITKVIKEPFKNLVSMNSLDEYSPEDVIIICTGSQAEKNSVLQRMSSGEHKFKLKKNDLIVFSSSVIPGNEKKIIDLKNSFLEKGIGIIDDPNVCLHASGHPGRPDIRRMLQTVNPKFFIPVHGNRYHLLMNCRLTKSPYLVPFNGCVIQLTKEKYPTIIGRVYTKRDAIDGNQLISMDSSLLDHRRQLAENGVVFIYQIGNNYKVFQQGLIEEKHMPKLLKVVFDAIDDIKRKKLEHNIRTHITFKINKEFGKSPFIFCSIKMNKNNFKKTQKNPQIDQKNS